jgi:WXG100 family type VII secretion target
MSKKGGNPLTVKIRADELIVASEDFQKASNEIGSIVERLNTSVKNLEDAWSDAGQQLFYQNYKEWETHMCGFSTMLQLISQNIQAVAQRYLEVDNKKQRS